MTGQVLALVADRREFLIMHAACARATPKRGYWYVADLKDPVQELLTDRCEWCRFRLCEAPDPHHEIRGGM